ncbi:putative lipase [Streptomyces albus]|uniref:Putative lipase n=1 Tax=Streptomyces albus (strain ATCC 21838 / DSM 41398 / FERM P-419 / JCM 4703 / NBRC 107858) TaxID=1081613 RepID=A0A0B5EQM3_STRA4|nr:putative lipase [Streptomyces albus]AOU74777.1 putative lipase [Streptomyces albus]
MSATVKSLAGHVMETLWGRFVALPQSPAPVPVRSEEPRMKTFTRRLLATAATLLLGAGIQAAPAAAAEPGPELQTPVAVLDQALSCSSDVAHASKTPVLLVHGTFSDPSETWSWGYQRVLSAEGYPVCTVTLPERATIDMQTTVEYVVHAIRRVNEDSGRKLSIVGHSQGGVLPAWALRFWPDLAARVDDNIALAGPQTGTKLASALCSAGSCPDIARQLAVGSDWMSALTRKPIDSSVSFTSIGSHGDEVVFPAPEATRFPGATNVMVQDLCPGRPVGHIGLLADAAAYALVTDALTHNGPADPGRVGGQVCVQGTYPGLDPVGMGDLLETGIAGLTAFATLPYTPHEPALRDYAVSG